MERLTKRFTDGTFYCEDVEDVGIVGINSPTYIGKVVNKLADYEDAEEQGLLLRLPCKEGSTVYMIKSRYTECTREQQEFDEYNCQGCEWLDCDSHKEYYIHTNKSVTLEWILRYSKDIGKTVFLTKEEAEQALKRMESK